MHISKQLTQLVLFGAVFLGIVGLQRQDATHQVNDTRKVAIHECQGDARRAALGAAGYRQSAEGWRRYGDARTASRMIAVSDGLVSTIHVPPGYKRSLRIGSVNLVDRTGQQQYQLTKDAADIQRRGCEALFEK